MNIFAGTEKRAINPMRVFRPEEMRPEVTRAELMRSIRSHQTRPNVKDRPLPLTEIQRLPTLSLRGNSLFPVKSLWRFYGDRYEREDIRALIDKLRSMVSEESIRDILGKTFLEWEEDSSLPAKLVDPLNAIIQLFR